MLTPFLFELRALMDWMWTDSSMPLFEWLKMEDIFAKIFELKVIKIGLFLVRTNIVTFFVRFSALVKLKMNFLHNAAWPKESQ